MYKFKIGESVSFDQVKMTIKEKIFNLVGQEGVVISRSIPHSGTPLYFVKIISSRGSHLWDESESHIKRGFELLVDENNISRLEAHRIFRKSSKVKLKYKIGTFTIESMVPIFRDSAHYYAVKDELGNIAILPDTDIA